MTFKTGFSNFPLRSLLIFWISCSFLFSNLDSKCFAQNTGFSLEMRFVKQNDSIKSTALYFNVLTICNTSSKKITGNLTFNIPDEWKIISLPAEQTVILPGDTIFVPIRISPKSNALGGIAYIINATFRTSKQLITASTYLTLPSVVKWEMTTNRTTAYITDSSPKTAFEIRLSNKGNTNELIKLKLEAGKLLTFSENSLNNTQEYVNLKAFTDTIITRSIYIQSKLSFSEKIRYENNWKESAINVNASTEQTEKSAAIQIHKLNSSYVNQRLQSASPLNLDYQVYNLMSNDAALHNIKLYGNLLFPENRELQYVAGVQNFGIGNNNEVFDINSQLVYDLKYIDNHNNIELGYNINGGSLHGINGRGISGMYNLNQRNSFSYAVTQNPYTQNIGEFIGFRKTFSKFGFNTEITHDAKSDGSYQATSGLLGFNMSFLRYHSISVQFLGSKSDYNKTLQRDTSVMGYSYNINYTIQYKKFNFRLSSLNSEHNYIQNSGLQQTYLDSRYNINDNMGITLYGSHLKYAITRFPYNFYNPAAYDTNDNFRLTTSLTTPNVTYQLGPNYTGSIRQTYNAFTHYKTEYTTYQPGVWCAATIKFDGYRSITPNLTVSNIRFYYKTDDPAMQNYSFDKNIYYSAGVSYFDNMWRVNAYYTSGSTTDLYRSVLIDATPTITRSIQVRPSYENYFFNRKIKLSASMNYAYYMPSGRENVSFNVKYDQFFKSGWNISVSGYLFSNTRVDDNQGRISTRDLNMVIGVTKSFNIQQPRQKYYNLKTVFFNDLDGNGIKTDNEPPVSNVLVNIQKDRAASTAPSMIPEVQLLSDVTGAIEYENLPKDKYIMSFNPLVNLQSLYFLKGTEQSYFNDKDRIWFVPLAESYKIKGKIIVVRDPNSTEGKIELGGIRVIATGRKGENYSALTDNFGSYILNVSKADRFKVHVNNVFGSQFNIDSNETEVQFSDNKTINLDFTFIEKKRGIQFDGGDELFKFSSLGDDSETPAVTKEVPQPKQTVVESPKTNQPVVETPKTYAIQLAALKTYRDPSYFKNKYNLKEDVHYTEQNGMFKYYTGSYTSSKAAKEAIAKTGITGIPIEVEKNTQPQETVSNQNTVEPSHNRPTTTNRTLSTNNQAENAVATSKQPELVRTEPVIRPQTKREAVPTTQKQPEQILNQNNQVFTPKMEPAKQQTDKTDLPVYDNGQQVDFVSAITDNPNIYTIQLDELKSYREPSYYNQKYRLKENVYYQESHGLFLYFLGMYNSMDEAKAAITRYGLMGYIVGIDKNLLKRGK